MADFPHRLAEDKVMRDAALGLFKSDLALVRRDLKRRGIGARLASRVGESTMDMVDEAADFAESNRGVVGAGIAAIVLWFARGPIFDLLGRLNSDDEDQGDDNSELKRTKTRSG